MQMRPFAFLLFIGFMRNIDGHRGMRRQARGLQLSGSPKSKVKVEVLYEALCPFCKIFLAGQVSKVMRSELGPWVDLHLYPYGNAHEQGGFVECQHGVVECRLNMLSACGIKKLNGDPDRRLAFVECVEKLNNTSNEEWRDCLAVAGKQKGVVAACFQGDEGQMVIKSIGKFSKRFSYNYVPWVIVNGRHSPRAESNLAVALCEELQTSRPHACSSLSHVGASSFLEQNQRCFDGVPSSSLRKQ